MARGQLRIYLGAAPGVGKTYAMLQEGRRRRDRGTDVVVAYVETHGRPNTAAQIGDLPVVPRTRYQYRGTSFEELDLDAVLARRPAVALVDELAHTNTPGLTHHKRWEDVEALLDAGIDVISTVNVQHLESLNDVVRHITGVAQRETVPDVVVRRAQQVELVDMTPEALRRRMAHGNIYGADRVDAALTNYFRPGNLAALRELALLWVADSVDESLHAYLEAHGIAGTWETRERIVVAVTGAPGGSELIRRAARMAARTRGRLLGVHVASASGLLAPSGELEHHRDLLRDLGGSYHEIVGDDVGQALAGFARAERATQLVLGASRRSRRQRLLHGNVIDRVLRHTGGPDVQVDVHVIDIRVDDPPVTGPSADDPIGVGDVDDTHVPDTGRRAPRRGSGAWPAGLRSGLPPGRQLLGAVAGVAVLGVATAALTSLGVHTGLSTVVLSFLAIVIVTTATAGPVAGLTVALAAFLLENFYFVEPTHTFTVASTEGVVSLIGFLAFAVTASLAADRLARRSREVERARAEANALARSAATLAADANSLPSLVDNLRTTFELDAVALLGRDDAGWAPLAVAGHPVPGAPEDGEAFDVAADSVLVLVGGPLGPEERPLVEAFADQAAAVLEARRLRREAAEAEVIARGDAFRTGLLRSVSHDLRTPLAGIKASVTSLLSDDVTWNPDVARDFLQTIDADCDRLTRLVGNLLDASRLQAGAVPVARMDVAVDDVLAAALGGVPGAEDPERLRIELPDDLPLLTTDPDLLERVLANVVANALRYSPPDRPVRVCGDAVDDRVELLVVDRGRGIPASRRDVVLRPFQRLGDQDPATGVGLGLAVAHGFTELLGGQLLLEDTPGGGLTVTISVPRVDAGAT